MAERRMFSKKITDSDAFLDMPLSTQCLYFHLSMQADDDGFVNNPRKIMRMIGASDDDARILISKRFILSFESGIIVIKHWRMHNYIRSDRYKPTTYLEEKSTLALDNNGSYTEAENQKNVLGIPNVNQMDTNGIPMVDTGKESISQVNLVEDNINTSPADEVKHIYGEYKKVKLTDSQYKKLCDKYTNADELIAYLDEAKERMGYKYKNDYLAIKKWVVQAVKDERAKKKPEIDTTYDIEEINRRIIMNDDFDI